VVVVKLDRKRRSRVSILVQELFVFTCDVVGHSSWVAVIIDKYVEDSLRHERRSLGSRFVDKPQLLNAKRVTTDHVLLMDFECAVLIDLLSDNYLLEFFLRNSNL
jgi:hypothetical protein